MKRLKEVITVCKILLEKLFLREHLRRRIAVFFRRRFFDLSCDEVRCYGQEKT